MVYGVDCRSLSSDLPGMGSGNKSCGGARLWACILV